MKWGERMRRTLHAHIGITRVMYVALAIILNSIGHSMTIVTNMGSMPWPATVVNIMHTMQWTMTQTIFTEGLVVIILNIIIAQRILIWDVLSELVFLIPYSILMQLFADCWRAIGIDKMAIPLRLCFDLVGSISAFVGFSIYQKANCCHPHDDLSITLKTHFSAKFMQRFNMYLPVVIVILCSIHNRAIWAVNIGTVVGFLIQGRVVNFCDEHITCYCHM